MGLNRRDLLLAGAGVVAAKATASSLACADESGGKKSEKGGKKGPAEPKGKAKEGKAEGHEGHEGHAGHDAGAGALNADMVAKAADCVSKGEACLAHCIKLLAGGDKSMGECAGAVTEMLAVCRMMSTLAAAGSAHLEAAAQLCVDTCKACLDACEPHRKHHAVCEACASACEYTGAEALKLTA